MVLENWRKKKNFEDTVMDSIEALKENDRRLKNRIDEVWNTMLGAQETSKEIRNEMYTDIKGMTEDIKSVKNHLDERNTK